MAINTFPVVNGDVLDADTINYLNKKGKIISDDAGPYTENTTTPTLKVTHVIPAGEVENNIDIIIEKLHNIYLSTSLNSGADKYYIRIDIGETGVETTKRTFYNKMYINGQDVLIDETNIYTYSPTTSEKTNGFNIKIYLYLGNIQVGGVSTALSKIGRTLIKGY